MLQWMATFILVRNGEKSLEFALAVRWSSTAVCKRTVNQEDKSFSRYLLEEWCPEKEHIPSECM